MDISITTESGTGDENEQSEIIFIGPDSMELCFNMIMADHETLFDEDTILSSSNAINDGDFADDKNKTTTSPPICNNSVKTIPPSKPSVKRKQPLAILARQNSEETTAGPSSSSTTVSPSSNAKTANPSSSSKTPRALQNKKSRYQFRSTSPNRERESRRFPAIKTRKPGISTNAKKLALNYHWMKMVKSICEFSPAGEQYSKASTPADLGKIIFELTTRDRLAWLESKKFTMGMTHWMNLVMSSSESVKLKLTPHIFGGVKEISDIPEFQSAIGAFGEKEVWDRIILPLFGKTNTLRPGKIGKHDLNFVTTTPDYLFTNKICTKFSECWCNRALGIDSVIGIGECKTSMLKVTDIEEEVWNSPDCTIFDILQTKPKYIRDCFGSKARFDIPKWIPSTRGDLYWDLNRDFVSTTRWYTAVIDNDWDIDMSTTSVHNLRTLSGDKRHKEGLKSFAMDMQVEANRYFMRPFHTEMCRQMIAECMTVIPLIAFASTLLSNSILVLTAISGLPRQLQLGTLHSRNRLSCCTPENEASMRVSVLIFLAG
ncbi:hypothetical protein EGW08_020751 [Elysia chlorotica]|uniref:Uncharacterized protein n=1 Tax=Elysia chlorotica TaxID=188477 RepID=A0A433SQG6_ELYCH|nr:hypothetical protein EGW08_020751 [Elysia chlorotica]